MTEKKIKVDFIENGVMAHACGEIDGFIYTNSKEAFENSLKKGINFIEVDFSFTSDEKVVAFHKWNDDSYERLGLEYPGEETPLSYEDFMNVKIHEEYTTMDLKNIIDYMREHEDLYIMIDIRKDLDEETTKKMYKIIVDELNDDKSLIDRVVVEAGTTEMFDEIDNIYNFPYKHFYISKKMYEKGKIDEILDYMDSHDNFVSVGGYKNAQRNRDMLKAIHKRGYYFFNFPVNTIKEAERYYRIGVDCIATDLLSYKDIKKIQQMPKCEILREFFKDDTFAAHIGINIDEAAYGEAICSLKIKDYHMNSAGTVQGGVIFTLADFAFAVAANSRGKLTVSVDNNISYFTPPKGEIITAKTKCLRRTKTMCFYDVMVKDELETSVAKMSVTGYIKDIDNFPEEENKDTVCENIEI